ncbi:MAG: Uma2 family endonuclease, partial [Cyanobacteria bacterium J06650_10]
MTYTLKRYQSYQEYLDAEELSPDGNYRLLSTGEVIEVPLENDINRLIANALIAALLKTKGISFIRYICLGNKEMQVHPVGDKCINRKPDVMVLAPSHLKEAKQALFLGMESPRFVAEVVSPGSPSSENYLRDYEWKRQQYEDWQIPEYWIIDPHREQVSVLTLVNGAYQAVVFAKAERIASTAFPEIE